MYLFAFVYLRSENIKKKNTASDQSDTRPIIRNAIFGLDELVNNSIIAKSIMNNNKIPSHSKDII